MKKGLTELVFILDKSGSMGGLEGDTIGGFNAMLQKHQAARSRCQITTVLFDNSYELLHDRIDIRAVSSLTENEYQVGGSTALLDAIGRTISKIASAQKHTALSYRAEKVLFVIITDGEENASREYTSDAIKAQIEQQKAKYGWEFIFLGANIDAVSTAASFGIGRNRAQNYHSDSCGAAVVYNAVAEASVSFGAAPVGVGLDDAWGVDIEADYRSREQSV
ncbi:MAG: VWA domain-containing protein [Oscillospiraceae bacterium]|jgi:uncharacterized protein YegL|nr:VWA domain-containing protein [Oscillospiraceae bacterium]